MVIVKYFLATLVLSCIAFGLYGQARNHDSLYVEGLNYYREFLLKEKSDTLRQYLGLIEKVDSVFNALTSPPYWEAKKPYSSDARFRLIKSHMRIVTGDSDSIKFSSNWDLFTTKEKEILLDHADILVNLRSNLYREKATLPIDRDNNLLQELRFYNIEKDDVVADIGTGLGTIGILLQIIYPDTEVHLQEIQNLLLEYLDVRLDKLSKLRGISKMEVLKGDKKLTGLHQNAYDKVICRNSFHHFSKKKQMLESIYLSLKEDGVLYLYEYKKGLKHCNDLMTSDKIISQIEKRSFSLSARKELKRANIYKFIKNGK